jgi:hypothetical protein
MPDDHDDRLTILERAQRLHDAVLQRHEADLQRHEAILAELRESNRQQGLRLTHHDDQLAEARAIHRAIVERLDHLDTTLMAIKDLLERWRNGH